EWFSILKKFDEYGFGSDAEYIEKVKKFHGKIGSVAGTGRSSNEILEIVRELEEAAKNKK
ncbi:MAG TPA: hypothetical protein VIN67_08155, partial [Desulfobaccales bacterium]